jgi:dihydrodipicolinate synthase/N-acetylneuraminate lyase
MDPAGETVDEAKFRRMLRYMADGGTNVFVGGPHATEFVTMDEEERTALWAWAVDELGGRSPVNAIPFGPGSTTQMVRRFAMAERMGFDGALLYPAAEGGHGGDGLFVAEAERYFRDVLEVVDLPVYLAGYHGGEIIDSPTGMVPWSLLAELAAEYEQVVGVTVLDTGGDGAEIEALIGALGGRCPVRLAGAHDWFARMGQGVFGFHSIQQSLAPRLCRSMMDAFAAGDLEAARERSQVIAELEAIVHTRAYAYPRSLKPLLAHLGFDVGSIRRPHLPPPEELRAEMCSRLDALHLERLEDLPAPR